MRRVCVGVCLLVMGVLAGTPAAAQQRGDLPEEARQELRERDMSEQEARQRLRQLGLNPDNPEEAIDNARQLGIPEARAQALLQAARPQRFGEEDDTTQADVPVNPPAPTLSGTPFIEPDSIAKEELPVDVDVTVPLRSRDQIQFVEMGFLTAAGDSVMLDNIQRIRGSVIDGTWRGETTIPRDTSHGTWSLYVFASTQDTSVTLSTGRRLTIFPEGEFPEPDTAGRDTLKYFGYDTFDTIPEAFTPQPTGPADDSYVVGPQDELRLTVWGGAEFTYELQVDREGRVTVPNLGQFTVAGRRLSELRTAMKEWLSRSYSGLMSEPQTVFMDLSLTRVRPSQVFVLGEVPQPGGYMVSSFATVFNALYTVGGPLQSGSLRDIKVIRDGEIVETVDLYEYLTQGYSPNPVQVQTNDYIFVPPRGETVAITGAVKRPAYYEMREDETMADLLEYAGGLQPQAYTKRLHIDRIVPFDERQDPSVAREVRDASLAAVRSDEQEVALSDGDRVNVLSISKAKDPAVKARIDVVDVTGAVYQPGPYELGGGVRTVKDLIEQADGLKGDAYREQAELIRLSDSLRRQTRTLNLNRVMDDEPQSNLVLRAGDSLHVAAGRTMRADRRVRIIGEVRNPGSYSFRDGMTVRSLLLKGGGLTDEEDRKDVLLGRADLFRESEDGDEERVIPFHLGDALEGRGMADRPLQPSDEIRVYSAGVERLERRFVQISGAVQDSGRYEYRDNMSLKDLILQAGGFEEGASLQRAEVTRMVERGDAEDLRANTLQVPLVDANVDPETVTFSVRDTMRALEAAEEFELRHRDRVFVRTDPTYRPQRTVTVRGEVRYPGQYTLLRDNERLSSVLQRAGGVRATGYLKGGRLLRGRDGGGQRRARSRTQDGNGERRDESERFREQVIVEMERALRGDPDEDVILRPGDEVVIPTQPNTVAVRGHVANEGLIKHESRERVDFYLDRAGGTRQDTEAIFLTQASGATFRVDTGWFRRSPRVDDGAVILVTQEPPTEDEIDYAGIASDVTQIISSTLSVVLLGTRVFD